MPYFASQTSSIWTRVSGETDSVISSRHTAESQIQALQGDITPLGYDFAAEMWLSYAALVLYATSFITCSTAASSPSSYWLANKPDVGTVAFQPDATYPVFRNVMDYGAYGESRPQRTTRRDPDCCSQEMAYMTTLMLSMQPSRLAIAAAVETRSTAHFVSRRQSNQPWCISRLGHTTSPNRSSCTISRKWWEMRSRLLPLQ